jgi:signal transduction histidine kinase
MESGNMPPTRNTGTNTSSGARTPAERSSPLYRLVVRPWLNLLRWVQDYTFIPDRFPAWARNPLVSYLGALALLSIALVVDAFLDWVLPTFDDADELVFLAVLLIALTWGLGPALLVAVLGMFLTDYLYFPPRFSILETRVSTLEDFLGLVIALLIALVATLHEAARRQAEDLKLQAEAARQESQELAASLEMQRAEMESFLAMTSHELKTPLTSLKLSLQLSQRRLRRKQAPAGELASALADLAPHLAHTERDIERLNHLVNDLLDVSRIHQGMLKLHLEPADLAAILSEAVEEQRQMALARVIQLSLPAVPPGPVLLDAERVKQVVNNYLTNALKYSPEDRPVEVGLEVHGPQARVWMRDAGPGIPPEEQERIWRRFYRVKGIEVQSGTGVGLGVGLHICRTIIEGHHGLVGVESAPGVGSTFWFTLPLISAEPPQQALPA